MFLGYFLLDKKVTKESRKITTLFSLSLAKAGRSAQSVGHFVPSDFSDFKDLKLVIG
jgi:hypothetical protein